MAMHLTRLVLGASVDRRIPDRVRAAIRDQQADSEILIGWVQLVIAVTWSSLYFVAPKTFMADVPFEPVPVALAFYTAFTLVRLALAYRHALPGWFLAASVVIDMTLLFGLIWSFHLQYGQPPAFYLKAPTLLYVFIFIVLRALRFDARFVLQAGVCAVIGWGALVAYSIQGMHIASPITRNYVEYMTSSRVLLGAEFDKMISILLVTGVLALAIVRARRLLIRSVVEQAAAKDLSRFFSPEIAHRITAADTQIAAGQGELRQAAILYCDIRGFTTLAKTLAPGTLMQHLADYEARMVPVIQRHGGAIDKFLGDGIMATFGAAVPSPTYAADALAAVNGLIEAADAWAAERRAAGEKPFAIGVAVAVGEVVFGAVGHDERLEYTVIGDAVNLAAKLEKHNKTAGTRALASDETLRRARAQGYTGPEPEILSDERVDGLKEPVDLAVMAR